MHQQAQTMIRERYVAQSRPHDHIYDPVFTVRANVKGLYAHQKPRGTARAAYRVKGAPVVGAVLDATTMIPSTSAADASQSQSSAQSQSVRHPSQSSEAVDPQTRQLAGPDRFKFYQRPHIPYLHSLAPEVLLAQGPAQHASVDSTVAMKTQQQQNSQQLDPRMAMLNDDADADEDVEGATRDVGTQSLYRESSAQTDPWTSDYLLRPGQKEPEVLSIAHLTFGNGLPASQEEVTMIHRARAKTAFEARLPPITDEASFEVRRRMLEEQEMAEWVQREKEMKVEEEARLQIMIDTLKEREARTDELNAACVELVRMKKTNERNEVFAKIHRERVKVLRSLAKNRKFLEHKSERRDVVAEYDDFGSHVYAPVAREGRVPVSNQVVDYGIPLLENFNSLSALEASLPSSYTTVRAVRPSAVAGGGGHTRAAQKIKSDLAYVDAVAKRQKEKAAGGVVGAVGPNGVAVAGSDAGAAAADKTSENVYKKFEPVVRARTPSVPWRDDEPEVAALILQRLIRGCAAQSVLYQGKQKCFEVIRELRIAEQPPDDVTYDDLEKSVAEKTVDAVQGEVVSDALDFVSKEIVRVQQERKIAEMVKEAARVRRIREAEESGRRQAETFLRLARDARYDEVMATHQSSVDPFLDAIVDRAVDTMAARTAAHESSIKATSLVTLMDAVQEKENDSATIARELVETFLLPEVERKRRQRQDDVRERRFTEAAHQGVYHVLDKILFHKEDDDVGVDAGTADAGDEPAEESEAI